MKGRYGNAEARSKLVRYLGWRDGWRCALCGCVVHLDRPVPGSVPATVDHIRPVSHGGTNHALNLRLACGACNEARGNATGYALTPRQARLLGTSA